MGKRIYQRVGILIFLIVMPMLVGCGFIGRTSIATYSSPNGVYSVDVDSYIDWVDNSHIEDNNEDGIVLDEDGGTTSILIQRIGYTGSDEIATWDLESYKDYVGLFIDFSTMNLEDTELSVNNEIVLDSKPYAVSMEYGEETFWGYLIFIKTDEAFYHITISGSDKDVVDHYSNIADTLSINTK